MTITREALEADLRLAEADQHAAMQRAAYIRQLIAYLEAPDEHAPTPNPKGKPDVPPTIQSLG